MSQRLGIFVSHPIQYFAPIWRELACTPGLQVVVHFFSDHSVRGGVDAGFGVEVKWDVPVLQGYDHRFLSRHANLGRPSTVSVRDACGYFRKMQFDWVMIHGYTHRFERQVVRAARRLGVRVLQRGEFSDRPRYGSRPSLAKRAAREAYLRWFYRQVDRFCYVGRDARDHLLRRGVSEERLFFSPYSVDSSLFDSFRRDISRQTARETLGIAPDQMALLFSGKLIPRKAPMLLLDAVERLGADERISLILVGSGELEASVRRRGAELLGSRFIAPGFVNQTGLGRYFRAADLFVHPARSETWGLVVNEAMHCGLPVIVGTNVGCHRDLVIPGETGEVFEDGSAPSLAGCIGRFLDEPGRLKAMGAAARRHVTRYGTRASVEGILAALGSDSRSSRRNAA